MGEGCALFGISMAAAGMPSIVGMIISNGSYGPIVDNARGLAEMGGLGDKVLAIKAVHFLLIILKHLQSKSQTIVRHNTNIN